MAIPDPSQVAPWYLRNITQALALDEDTGNVYVRTDSQVSIANANVVISDITVDALGNIDISGNTMPVSGNVTVFQGTDPWNSAGQYQCRADWRWHSGLRWSDQQPRHIHYRRGCSSTYSA
jgi:hypothetical protein